MLLKKRYSINKNYEVTMKSKKTLSLLSIVISLFLITATYTTVAILSSSQQISFSKTRISEQQISQQNINHFNETIQQTPSNALSEIPMTTTNGPGGYPPLWNTAVNTGNAHIFSTPLSANPRVNDMPLQYGDWFGGFYLDENGNRKCGGARMWTGISSVNLALFGNDGSVPEKNGFASGELVEFRVFMWATQKEYIVTDLDFMSGPYYVSNGKWYSMSLSMIENMKAEVNFDFYINASSNPICITNEVTLSAIEFVGSAGPYTFEWSSDPPGFTSNLQTPPPVSPTQTTIYKLNVSDGIHYSTHQLPLIVHVNPSAFAGDDAVICENMNHQLTGSAENYSELLWISSGDGSFSNPSILNPVYTPGQQDKTNGEVTLSITAIPLSPCSIAATDSMVLSLSPLPLVDAGEDFSVCTNEPAILTAVATEYSSLLWTTSGSGTFSDPHSLQSIYYPSTTDVNNGMVTLTITASAVSPCIPPASDTVSVSFMPGPSISAPTGIHQCEDQGVSIICYPSYYSSILWTTPGDGYFEDPTATSTTYHPGMEDISNGGVVVTVYAFAQDPCTIPASKDVQLVIVNLPTVNAGGYMTMSTDDLYIQLSASVSNYTTCYWSSYGDGFFTSLTNPITRYYPGVGDKANKNFTLILTANPKQYCSTPISDEVHVTILDDPLPPIPPTISLQPILNHSTLENQPYSYQVLFDEVESTEPVLFSLLEKPTGMSIDSSTGLIQWLPGFNDRGVHTVTVKAMYSNYPEVSDSVSYELTVLYEIINPIADFSYTPESPLVDEIIQFTDLSMDPDGTVVGWSWVFGDEGSSTLQHPTHVYSSEGTYMVSLTVTDDDGATDTIAKEIIVEKDDSHSIVVQYHLSKGVNYISFDFLPDSLAIEDIFAPLTASNDLLMIIADNAIGGYYLPAWNINTLGNNGQIELYRGYKVVMNEDAILNVSGTPCTENIVLDLVVGANFVSFSNETVVLDIVGDLFDNDSLSMIIDLSCTQGSPVFLKKLWNNDFLGSLELFQPGHIYLFIIYDAFSLIVN
jgi:PKD repeat protein